jgi:hypothetical protein
MLVSCARVRKGKDILMSLSFGGDRPLDTANYMCIVDALTPDPGANSTVTAPACIDNADADAHAPSGYMLCNTVPLPLLTTSPIPISPHHPTRAIKAEVSAPRRRQRRTTAATKKTVTTSSPDMDVRKAPLASVRKAVVSRTKRGSGGEYDGGAGSGNWGGSGSGNGNTSRCSTWTESMYLEHSSSSSAVEPTSTPPRTDSSSSSFSNSMPRQETATQSQKSPSFRIPAALLLHGASTAATASFGSAIPTITSERQEVTTRSKRNLFGNWATGCRKMFGMGAMDDLGIYFMFNVSPAPSFSSLFHRYTP